MVWREITIDADISYAQKRIIRDKVQKLVKLNDISNYVATVLQPSDIIMQISNFNHLHIIAKPDKLNILAKVAQMSLHS